jgi:uridine kinase
VAFDAVAYDLAERIRAQCPPARSLVAVDGPGGAGKSTLALRLARALGDATIVPTDDFATWNDPLDWWHRMSDEVIRPIAQGRTARYRRRDFLTGRFLDWVMVPTKAVTIIEGVSSSRREWADRLCFSVWIETPRDERLRRGLERDGADALPAWEGWMAAEDEFFELDRPWERADAIIAGVDAAR